MTESEIELLRTLGLALGGGVVTATSTLIGVVITQRNGRKIAKETRRQDELKSVHQDVVDVLYLGRKWVRRYGVLVESWSRITEVEKVEVDSPSMVETSAAMEGVKRALTSLAVRVDNEELIEKISGTADACDHAVKLAKELLPGPSRVEGEDLELIVEDMRDRMRKASAALDDLQGAASKVVGVSLPTAKRRRRK